MFDRCPHCRQIMLDGACLDGCAVRIRKADTKVLATLDDMLGTAYALQARLPADEAQPLIDSIDRVWRLYDDNIN